MTKENLYNLYNGTSTIDEKTGDLETYENWLERQLISRELELKELRTRSVTKDKCKSDSEL